MNMKSANPFEEAASTLLKAVGHPTRLEILLAIGDGEACVCHLESVLGQRQAYISQQLMALREADVLTTRQEGRYVFYRLKDQRLLEMVALVGRMLGYSQADYQARNEKMSQCDCPHCTGSIECC